MPLSPKQLAQTLVDHVSTQSDNQIRKTMKQFVRFLAEEHMLGAWREIEKEIHLAWQETFGASKINVLSAHPLTQEAKEHIERVAPGAEKTFNVDDRLIGGVAIRMDDTRIDGSLAGAIRRLKTTLQTEEPYA